SLLPELAAGAAPPPSPTASPLVFWLHTGTNPVPPRPPSPPRALPALPPLELTNPPAARPVPPEPTVKPRPPAPPWDTPASPPLPPRAPAGHTRTGSGSDDAAPARATATTAATVAT